MIYIIAAYIGAMTNYVPIGMNFDFVVYFNMTLIIMYPNEISMLLDNNKFWFKMVDKL